jgi:hypothetical protein
MEHPSKLKLCSPIDPPTLESSLKLTSRSILISRGILTCSQMN